MEIHRRPPSLGGSGPSGFPRNSALGLGDLEVNWFHSLINHCGAAMALVIQKIAVEEFGRFKDHEGKDEVNEKDKEVKLQAVHKRLLKLKDKNLANDGSTELSLVPAVAATEDDHGTSSGHSNLRKVPTISKQQRLSSSQPLAYNWNGEFPASVVRTDVKQDWKKISFVPALAIQKLEAEEFGRFKDHEGKDEVKEKDKDVELQLLQAVQKRSLKLKDKNLANDGSAERSLVPKTENNQGTSSGHSNLRKVPTLSKQQQRMSSSQPSAYNRNEEFPASVVRTDVKQGWKKLSFVPSLSRGLPRQK
ncbi:uncharacterized protein LOC127241063 isoform X2 [Andrographis paniculata]|uniref:uncharacterized protein LOC127241063 isoform X2 n=1 Tax=Andrographis paniculata TaxID=175694 RepID=UPI0021E7AC00|nr:uncharacterized protein LOC127241063 isoform X2 [Andrographis paniculata]